MSQLKLIALDAEDLKVISSCCQDAILKVGNMDFLNSEKRFVMSLNRFAWEEAAEKAEKKERRQSALHFERVNKVSIQGIDRRDKEVVLSLLAILFEEAEAPGGTIELVFAGDGAIRLEVECIEVQLADMRAAWEPQSIPSHA